MIYWKFFRLTAENFLVQFELENLVDWDLICKVYEEDCDELILLGEAPNFTAKAVFLNEKFVEVIEKSHSLWNV